jgi:hypothetical protein
MEKKNRISNVTGSMHREITHYKHYGGVLYIGGSRHVFRRSLENPACDAGVEDKSRVQGLPLPSATPASCAERTCHCES